MRVSIIVFFAAISIAFSQTKKNVPFENISLKASYNEAFEQPNWVRYQVRDAPKRVSRSGMSFYKHPKIHTSNGDDYEFNDWDKGHLAPAGAFMDDKHRLKATFTYINVALQHYKLNRGTWKSLESNVYKWAKKRGTIDVFIELVFEPGHKVLNTRAHVPTGFRKHITFSNGSKKCYYFPNTIPTKKWNKHQIKCKI